MATFGVRGGRWKFTSRRQRIARDFIIELLTIVAGIVIAIGLEQAVESLHWHGKVAAARESIRDELRNAEHFYAFRAAAHQCVAQRLQLLNEIVELEMPKSAVDAERIGVACLPLKREIPSIPYTTF